MNISEMTLEQLQDYALQLEQERDALNVEKETLTQEKTELTEINKTLIKRNNDLFIKVEQGTIQPTPADPTPQTETCEAFAKNLVMGGKI